MIEAASESPFEFLNRLPRQAVVIIVTVKLNCVILEWFRTTTDEELRVEAGRGTLPARQRGPQSRHLLWFGRGMDDGPSVGPAYLSARPD